MRTYSKTVVQSVSYKHKTAQYVRSMVPVRTTLISRWVASVLQYCSIVGSNVHPLYPFKAITWNYYFCIDLFGWNLSPSVRKPPNTVPHAQRYYLRVLFFYRSVRMELNLHVLFVRMLNVTHVRTVLKFDSFMIKKPAILKCLPSGTCKREKSVHTFPE